MLATASATATLGMAPNEAGIASAMVNTSQQTTAVASYLTSHPHVPGLIPAPAVHGDTTGFLVGRRDLRPGLSAPAGDPAQPMRSPHGEHHNRPGPTRDRQLQTRRDRSRSGRHRQPGSPEPALAP